MTEKTPPLSKRMLCKRADFTEAARGFRVYCACLSVQTRKTSKSKLPFSRFGLTVTKKTGNAPERSRIKRRLRAAIREIDVASPSDYVVIARREALSRDFTSLQLDMRRCFQKLQRMKSGAIRQQVKTP